MIVDMDNGLHVCNVFIFSTPHPVKYLNQCVCVRESKKVNLPKSDNEVILLPCGHFWDRNKLIWNLTYFSVLKIYRL